MKISVLLFVLTIIPLLMDAQQITLAEAEAYAEQLVNKEVLNAKGKEVLLQALHKNEATEELQVDYEKYYTVAVLSKENILWFCRRAFWYAHMHRLFHPSGIEDKIVVEDTLINKGWTAYPPRDAFETYDYIHPKRSTLGRTRTRTLENFKELGLISGMVYEEAKKKLLDGVIEDEGALLEFLFERSCYYSKHDAE